MRFQELQAIWETQVDKPLFSINEFGLHMALYQQRERARRRLFWAAYFPFYVAAVVILGLLAVLFPALYFKGASTRDFPMNFGDGLAILVAAGSCLIAASSMYRSRRRHEKQQNVFAPSLRQEIDRGIAQGEFEIDSATSRLAWQNCVLVDIGALLFSWEVGRLNGNPAPWGLVLFVLVIGIAAALPGLIWGQRARRTLILPRKRALEALRAKLDEGAAATQQ